MICDNTDHKGKKNVKLYRIKLSGEFEGDKCDWCDECIVQDWNMLSLTSRKRMGEIWEKEDKDEAGGLHNFQDNICKTCGVVAETDMDGNRVAEDY